MTAQGMLLPIGSRMGSQTWIGVCWGSRPTVKRMHLHTRSWLRPQTRNPGGIGDPEQRPSECICILGHRWGHRLGSGCVGDHEQQPSECICIPDHDRGHRLAPPLPNPPPPHVCIPLWGWGYCCTLGSAPHPRAPPYDLGGSRHARRACRRPGELYKVTRLRVGTLCSVLGS